MDKRVFGRWSGHERGALTTGQVLLRGDTCENLLPGSLRPVRTQREAIHLRRTSPRGGPIGPYLDRGLAASGTVRHECLPHQPPALHTSVRGGPCPLTPLSLRRFRGFLLCELSLRLGPRHCPALPPVRRTSRLPRRHRGLSRGASGSPWGHLSVSPRPRPPGLGEKVTGRLLSVQDPGGPGSGGFDRWPPPTHVPAET